MNYIKVPLKLLESTSSSHNNKMEGEIMGSRSIGCMSEFFFFFFK